MQEVIKYFLYVRKSTDTDDKQVQSVEAQLTELREQARNLKLVVKEEFEKKSAKAPGRPVFEHMVHKIENGEAHAILTWHPDRLARNSVDGGKIIYLMDIGKLRRIQFHGSAAENTPQAKVLLSVEFGFSKYYVDELSENVKRGHRSKLRRGESPCLAPLGYVNHPRKKKLAVSPYEAPLVRKAFDMYASENASLDSLRQFFFDHGIKTRRTRRSNGGKLIGRTRVSDMLSNPIYYGHFKWAGEVHVGVHVPIISKQLFDKTQKVLDRRWRWSPSIHARTTKPFTKLLHCGECGGAISAEIQKGHTYYRCTKKKKNKKCTQPYLREELLATQISKLLMNYRLADDLADKAILELEDKQRENVRITSAAVRETEEKVTLLKTRLNRLTELLLDGVLDSNNYLAERTSIFDKRASFEEEKALLEKGSSTWLEPLKEWLKEAKSVSTIVEKGSLFEKAALAKKVFGSNLYLEGKEARGEAVKPWSILAVNELSHDTAHLLDTARTFFVKQRNLLGQLDSNQRADDQDRTEP